MTKVEELKIVDHPDGDGPAVSVSANIYGVTRKIKDLICVIYEAIDEIEGLRFYDLNFWLHRPYYPGIDIEHHVAPSTLAGPFLQYLYSVQDKYPTIRVYRKVRNGTEIEYLDYI